MCILPFEIFLAYFFLLLSNLRSPQQVAIVEQIVMAEGNYVLDTGKKLSRPSRGCAVLSQNTAVCTV